MTYPKLASLHHRSLPKLSSDDRGLSTVEYVVILVLIAVAAIGTWRQFGSTIMTKVDKAGDCIRDMEGNCSTSGTGESTPVSNNSPGNNVTPKSPANNPANVVTPTQQPVTRQAKGKVAD